MHLDINEMNWPSRCCGLESCKKKPIKLSPNQLSTCKNACVSLARIITLDNYYRRKTVWSDGRTIRKLMGGGRGAGEVQKKYSRKGELNEKKLCMPINPKKNIHATV